jgi:streptomycin 6-kinase
LHYTALNELFVFSKLPQLVWQQILNSCFDFINSCQQHSAPDNATQGSSLSALFEDKTTQRLTEYCLIHGLDFQQQWHYNDQFSASFEQLLTLSQQYLPKTITHATVLHGDFCFSNILYDFRMGRIKTIDPRGIDLNNELTIYGDTRYDLAKLSHSILGTRCSQYRRICRTRNCTLKD